MNPNIFEEGQVLLIDKPLRWTSFDVVKKIRWLAKVKKVGHAGTLDPLATGLLIVCTGRFTKRINTYMAQEKEYQGVFTLGATTPTYDLESEPVPAGDPSAVTAEALESVFASFRGEIFQVPPAHSAIKKDGQRVYMLARKGKPVELAPRPVVIQRFDMDRREGNEVAFRVACSTGTYIRSLAQDVGKALGCGAYLSALRRTRIGEFSVDRAMNMEQAQDFIRRQLSKADPAHPENDQKG